MRKDVIPIGWVAEGTEAGPEKPGPIRPKGAVARWPFILLVVVGALFIGYRYVADSDLYRAAETFVRQHEEIGNAIGEVRNCRLWFPLKADFPNSVLRVHLTLRVEGAKADTMAHVTLLREGEKWRVVAASYEDPQGKTRPLLTAAKSVAAKGGARPAAGPAGPQAEDGPEGEEVKRGHQAFGEKQYGQAAAAYDRAVQIAPDSYVAHYWRGRAFAEQGVDHRALVDFQKAVELRPDDVYAWRWLGHLQAKTGRYDDCVASLTRAIGIQANDAWSLYNRGRCHFHQGDKAKALADAERSCSLGLKDGCRIAAQIRAGK